MLDELGDVLFQVHFLSLLLEERGAGDLGQVAEHCRQKLIRRHPHVFGATTTGEAFGLPGGARPETAGQVLRNWDQIKTTEPGRERGLFAEVPENLPGPLYARKVQRRAASSGFDPLGAEQALEAVRATTDEADRDGSFEAVGDMLFAAGKAPRELKVDPELALRASAERFRGRLEAAAELARASGEEWAELGPDRQLDLYAQVRLQGAEPGER